MSEQIDTGTSIIRLMPPELANKIAAGEVIQRPGSVVKELLDNAIDAGADSIRVIIQNSGRTLVQVMDNGCGMGKDDIRPCFLQHATSKITAMEDLFRIRTLGFRGEAMASIASISQVELTTKRTEDETGHIYIIEGGEEKKFEPGAADNGTSVAVRNLFYNVPARRQFLKTDATEFRHILRSFQCAALAHPDLSFELVADTDLIYKLPPAALEERVTSIFGRQYRSSLVSFYEKTSYVEISGVLGDPKISKKSRGEQFIFVNGRPVQHRYLSHVVLNVYENFIGEKEYPFFALFLRVKPSQVDVNVHPAKLEVKFEDERSMIQLAKSVVMKALNEYLMVPHLQDPRGAVKDDFDLSFEKMEFFSNNNRAAGSGTDEVHVPSRINFKSGGRDIREAVHKLYEKGRNVSSSEGELIPTPTHASGFWQLHDCYILNQTRTGICVIDQYRAHMRIIFEKALSATEEALPGTQQLLFAQSIEFSATDFALLKELLPIIQRMGFSIQLLSGNAAIINGVPADIDIGDEQSVVRELLHQYRDLDQKLQLDKRNKVAIAFASRTAIPRGRRLTGIEMETIVDQLFACKEPYTDPLKKPTLVYLSMDEIQKRFR